MQLNELLIEPQIVAKIIVKKLYRIGNPLIGHPYSSSLPTPPSLPALIISPSVLILLFLSCKAHRLTTGLV